MRLMHPSPGEAYDRLTILNLKIKFAREKKKENIIGGFIEEQAALVKYLADNQYVVPSDLANELGRINTRLWDLEDRQRHILQTSGGNVQTWLDNVKELFLLNATSVVELNDARAETVQKINASCGINAPEKLHDIVKNN